MMSDFNYSLDTYEDYEQGYEEGSYQWGPPAPPGPIFNTRRPYGGHNMYTQYSEAYGNYRGGYGPGDGYGPGSGFGPNMQQFVDCSTGGYGPDIVFEPSGYGPGGYGGPRFQPYPPSPARNRGLGPIGQQAQSPALPAQNTAQFLAKCDIAPEYIKALPQQLLDMFQPEHCGLCDQNFESFTIAKLHYNCKNHYKAQKKYNTLRQSLKNNNEIPMKARILYCELCDVHITSISHANSHYAGRSHRSIVEGRKPPKNPILHQTGMKTRVEQLIRREHKTLNVAPEAVDVPNVLKDKRNIPPEFFCEICKTSVTCSEQMTCHLNGKKHLTKEKYHILRMMNGETDKKKDQNEDEEEGIADAADDAADDAAVDAADDAAVDAADDAAVDAAVDAADDAAVDAAVDAADDAAVDAADDAAVDAAVDAADDAAVDAADDAAVDAAVDAADDAAVDAAVDAADDAAQKEGEDHSGTDDAADKQVQDWWSGGGGSDWDAQKSTETELKE